MKEKRLEIKFWSRVLTTVVLLVSGYDSAFARYRRKNDTQNFEILSSYPEKLILLPISSDRETRPVYEATV